MGLQKLSTSYIKNSSFHVFGIYFFWSLLLHIDLVCNNAGTVHVTV